MTSNMLIDDHKREILTLLRDGTELLKKIGDNNHATCLSEIQRETEEKKSPAIMFYGLYNAGKSTIINALFQEKIAKTGDVPTTDSIQKLSWEGFTLVDTPGIDARENDTKKAKDEIRRSDVILFVMDNADTFDNAIVYQEIVDILKEGKPLAIVVNQKNIDDDPNIPVPNQRSIQTIVGKISSNLERQGTKSGMQIAGKVNNFLGIFPVNALMAFEAGKFPGEDGKILYEASGILSLRNAMNDSIRRSEFIYMLRTPLLSLSNILNEAMKKYQDTTIYGEKKELAENRDSLIVSRQRLRDRLMADGLRKIESILESIKAAVAAGQTVEGMDEELSDELNLLLQDALGQENEILRKELKLEAMPDCCPVGETETTSDTEEEELLDTAEAAATVLEIISVLLPETLPTPIPVPLIIGVLRLIKMIFKPDKDKDAEDAARRSQEQLAQYYKWLNELRDQEIKIKANYEKAVDDILRKYYDTKLSEIDQALAEVDDDCAEHTKNLRAMEQLLLRVGNEMIALPVVL